ncbi:hypothetical protein ABTL56_19875, partial [Acinetobacter baumannii]
MFELLDGLLSRRGRDGSWTVIDASGASHTYGDGHGAPVAIRITDSRLERHLAADPELALGEG